jgi:hypothetical protein
MADSFTQVYVHIVFIVQDRNCVISDSWKDELYKYIAGIIKNNKHKLLAINKEEYIRMLKNFEIQYEEQHLFKWVE